MKKIILLLIAMLAIIPLVNAQGKNWRYRGEVKLSAGTQFVILPSTVGLSTTHGAMFKDRLFIGVEAGFQSEWTFSRNVNFYYTLPAFLSIEGRFPFKKNDRNSFLLGCGLGGKFAPIPLSWDSNFFNPALKIPLGFEFRLKDNRSAFAVMLEIIPVSFEYYSPKERYMWDPIGLGARLSLGFRF